MGETNADRAAQGRRIATARRIAGYTQRALADKLSVTPQAVSLWEAGQYTPAPLRQAALARILGRDWAGLFDHDAAGGDDDGEAA